MILEASGTTLKLLEIIDSPTIVGTGFDLVDNSLYIGIENDDIIYRFDARYYGVLSKK